MKVTLNSVLAGICVLIVLAILIGTGIVLGAQKDQEQANPYSVAPVPTPEQQIQQAIQAQQNADSATEFLENSDEFGVYKNLGQIRATTMADPENQTTALVIVEPWFSYENKDTAFQEELSSKRDLFNNLFLQFFSSRTYGQLRAMGEGQVKTQLLETINQELVLGSISAIYFEDYLFFE